MRGGMDSVRNEMKKNEKADTEQKGVLSVSAFSFMKIGAF